MCVIYVAEMSLQVRPQGKCCKLSTQSIQSNLFLVSCKTLGETEAALIKSSKEERGF